MKKHMSLDDAIDLMDKAMPEISDDIVKLCYCYSKMTIIDEMKEMDRYDKLEFVEFLEFIGRVANELSPNDPKSKLLPKIERVLQRILSLISERVRYTTSEIELLSESDSEPYKH